MGRTKRHVYLGEWRKLFPATKTLLLEMMMMFCSVQSLSFIARVLHILFCSLFHLAVAVAVVVVHHCSYLPPRSCIFTYLIAGGGACYI